MHLSGQWTDKVRASAGNVSAEGEAYREAFEEAQEMACDAFEYEARRRAIEGVKRFKFHNGKPIIDPETGQPYFEYEYSDTLLIFLLKGAMPEKYRERFERSAAPDYHSSAGLGVPVGPIQRLAVRTRFSNSYRVNPPTRSSRVNSSGGLKNVANDIRNLAMCGVLPWALRASSSL